MNNPRPELIFTGLCGISAVLWSRPLLDTFQLAFADDKYTHIPVTIPLAVTLILQNCRERPLDRRFWTPAAAPLMFSLVIAAAARWGNFGATPDSVLSIEMVGLVIWWISSFALCFGLSALQSSAFPLFLLFWLVPIPRIALGYIVSGLQQESTLAAQWLFLLFRIPVSREGITLSIPGLDLDVTVECSSIRSSLMLLVTTMVLAYLLLRTPWRRLLLVVLAIPLSVAKNGFRIFTIGMLGTRLDPAYLTGRFHHHGGIVFFLIALGLIFLLLWLLRRGEEFVPPRLNHARS